jgi:predicted nuclease of predicted toxin-antitoxin system
MKIRFQADADFNCEIVDGLLRHEPTMDFQTANDADLHGLPDEDVLEIAARNNRILVSHDRKTKPLSLITCAC